MFWDFLGLFFFFLLSDRRLQKHKALIIPFQPSLYQWSVTGSHFCCFDPPPCSRHTHINNKQETCIVSRFSSVCTLKAGDFISAALKKDIIWNNICIYHGSCLLNNCHYWCVVTVIYSREPCRITRIRLSEGERRRKKKNHITCWKGTTEAAIMAAAHGGEADKKKNAG